MPYFDVIYLFEGTTDDVRMQTVFADDAVQARKNVEESALAWGLIRPRHHILHLHPLPNYVATAD